MSHTVGVHGILIIRWCVSHLIWSVEFVHEQPFQIGSNARCNDLRHTLFQNPCCRIESCCQQSQTIRFEVGIQDVGIRECVGPLVDKAIVEAGEKGINNGIKTRALYPIGIPVAFIDARRISPRFARRVVRSVTTFTSQGRLG